MMIIRSKIKGYYFSSVQDPEIIKKFELDPNTKFKCPIHGLVKWTLSKKKREARKSRNIRKESKNKSYVDKYIHCRSCKNEYQSKFIRNNPIWYMYNQSKLHAKKKNFQYKISLEDISNVIKKQKNICTYTKIRFDKKYRPSLDRVSSHFGYIASNIEAVIQPVNLMKQDLSKSEFIKLCKLIKNPSKIKGNLHLLKNSKRRKTKLENEEDLKKFYNKKEILCYVHNYHTDFFLSKNNIVSCKKCYNYTYLKRGSRKEKRLLNNKNVLKFKKEGRANCKKHGLHKEFILEIDKRGKKIERVRCRKCMRLENKKWYKTNIFSNLFKQAKNRNTKFNLTYSDLLNTYIAQNGKCALTGIILDDKDNKPSIDKIDPKRGYLKDNIQLTTYLANRTKWDIPINEFYKIINLININRV